MLYSVNMEGQDGINKTTFNIFHDKKIQQFKVGAGAGAVDVGECWEAK